MEILATACGLYTADPAAPAPFGAAAPAPPGVVRDQEPPADDCTCLDTIGGQTL